MRWRPSQQEPSPTWPIRQYTGASEAKSTRSSAASPNVGPTSTASGASTPKCRARRMRRQPTSGSAVTGRPGRQREMMMRGNQGNQGCHRAALWQIVHPRRAESKRKGGTMSICARHVLTNMQHAHSLRARLARRSVTSLAVRPGAPGRPHIDRHPSCSGRMALPGKGGPSGKGTPRPPRRRCEPQKLTFCADAERVVRAATDSATAQVHQGRNQFRSMHTHIHILEHPST